MPESSGGKASGSPEKGIRQNHCSVAQAWAGLGIGPAFACTARRNTGKGGEAGSGWDRRVSLEGKIMAWI